jgi:hypothetical protein
MMEVDLTEDCEGPTVHDVSFVHRMGPVLYASVPCATSSAETLKHLLVSVLWEHLMAMDSPLWKCCESSHRAGLPIQVVSGLLGRPHLLIGEYPGPAVSFSHGGGKVWAALCGDESDVGIDVAGPNEFTREYPFHRVFQPEELQHALRLTDGDPGKAAALLWSVKEAVVKALGSAFHLVAPRQITVYPSREPAGGEKGGYVFPVGLSGQALKRLERFPLAARGSLSVRSLSQRQMWLSIALLNRRAAGPEYSPEYSNV